MQNLNIFGNTFVNIRDDKESSKFQHWLEFYEQLKTNKNLSDDIIKFSKFYTNVFSHFLTLNNPEYHYNKTYLPSFIDDFLYVTDLLIDRMEILKNLVPLFDGKLKDDICLEEYIISLDDVVFCSKKYLKEHEYSYRTDITEFLTLSDYIVIKYQWKIKKEKECEDVENKNENSDFIQRSYKAKKSKISADNFHLNDLKVIEVADEIDFFNSAMNIKNSESKDEK